MGKIPVEWRLAMADTSIDFFSFLFFSSIHRHDTREVADSCGESPANGESLRRHDIDFLVF